MGAASIFFGRNGPYGGVGGSNKFLGIIEAWQDGKLAGLKVE
jgi:hypothetical protein